MAKKKEMIIGITAVLFVILIGWLVYLKSYHNTAVLDDKVTANAKDRQDEQEEKQEEQGENRIANLYSIYHNFVCQPLVKIK